MNTAFPLPDCTWEVLGAALHISGRELQIVRAIVDGRTEAQIAIELGISPHTVHSYLTRLHRKLGVDARCGVVSRVFREYVNLTPLPHSQPSALLVTI